MGIDKPTLVETDIWASAGTAIKPDDGSGEAATFEAGWVYGQKIPYAWRNWIEKTNSEMLVHINQNGVPVWDEYTDYQEGARTIYDDGTAIRFYVANAGVTIGSEPASDNSNTDWLVDISLTPDNYTDVGGAGHDKKLIMTDGSGFMDSSFLEVKPMYYKGTADFTLSEPTWDPALNNGDVVINTTAGAPNGDWDTGVAAVEIEDFVIFNGTDWDYVGAGDTNLEARIAQNETDIGDTTHLTTDTKVSTVAAINETNVGKPTTSGYILSSTTGGVKTWIAPTVVINNLTSTSTTSALSANQGKVLEDSKEDDLLNPGSNGHILSSTTAGVRSWVANTTVVNNLTSTSTTSALSAAQGKALDTNKEDDLGDPTTTGFILSSTALGVRSWVANAGVTVVDDLTTGGTTSALSAEQGKTLQTTKEADLGDPTTNGYLLSSTALGVRSWVANTTVVNNLTSTSTTSALSAAQGKALEDKKVNSVTSGSEVRITSIVSMTQAAYDGLGTPDPATLYIIAG